MKKVALIFFGWLANKTIDSFLFLKPYLSKANIRMLLRTYLAISYFMTFLASCFIFMFVFSFTYSLGRSLLECIVFSVGSAIFIALIAFTVSISYPMLKTDSRRRNIETNLPFAITHMAAIASSGVPPSTMFRLLTGFEEYGEISKEAKKIVQNIDVLGMDITTAIRDVARKTPSENFKQFLEGVATTIDTGGDLHSYLKKSSENAMFEYKLRREKYLQTLSTYADFYTAVLIAAPLFLVAILSVMTIIEGKVFGMSIPEVMFFGIFFGIPIINALFLLFLHLTQPEL